MGLKQEGNDIGIHNCRCCGVHLESDRPRAFLAKRPDQCHKLLRAFRVMFDVGFQIFYADRRLEDNASRKPYVIRACFRSLGPLWHVNS